MLRLVHSYYGKTNVKPTLKSGLYYFQNKNGEELFFARFFNRS